MLSRRHARRQVNRRRHPVLRGQVSGQRRPDEEADAERDADQAERLRALARLGVIRDVGLRQRQVAGRRSVEHARDVEHPERRAPRHHDESDERADLADEEHRLAADAVRHVPDDRSRHQLARGVHRDEHRRLQRRRVQRFRVDRQQRDDQRHPEDVDENDEEDGKKGDALGFLPWAGGHTDPLSRSQKAKADDGVGHATGLSAESNQRGGPKPPLTR